jgi:DNA-binding HxlR family transcriptional regulator
MPQRSDCTRVGCPLTRALVLLGDRWSLLVIRDIMIFNLHEIREFLGAGEGLGTNILNDRLKSLSSQGIIDSIRHPTNGTWKLYYLTGKGKSLYPLLRGMFLWGSEHCDGVQFPSEKIDRMRNHEEEFRKDLMDTLMKWEEGHLPGDRDKWHG